MTDTRDTAYAWFYAGTLPMPAVQLPPGAILVQDADVGDWPFAGCRRATGCLRASEVPLFAVGARENARGEDSAGRAAIRRNHQAKLAQLGGARSASFARTAHKKREAGTATDMADKTGTATAQAAAA